MSTHVTLPDGNTLELADNSSGADVAAAIGAGLARAALAIEVDGELRDLARPVDDGASVSILTAKSDGALDLIRHDAAHVLAAAVMELHPGVKISIGPAIENGFYYDFDFPPGISISEEDLPAIEAKMLEHVRAAEPFVREELPVAAARERFLAEDQPYKVELIDDLVRDQQVQTVSLYTNGPFTDLCRGPHAPSTDTIKAFALQSVAGAYWRGDSKRAMLTRIYGTAFLSKADLEEHLERRLREERRAVNPGEHRPLRVSTPVRAGHRLQGKRLDRGGARGVRAATEVGERAVGVQRHRLHVLVAHEVVDQLDLVRLLLRGEARARQIDGELLADERLGRPHVLEHLGFDRGEVLI